MNDTVKTLGPLGALLGTWEGKKGADIAPSDTRGVANSAYRETMVFEDIGRVDNHEQILYGMRYRTTAWRVDADNAFHEEVGYWLWDAANKQVMRCFMPPRGMTIMAGGTCEADATTFEMAAHAGSESYGICSNLFLLEQFKTVRYELKITVHGADSFSYESDTQLKLKGQDDIFHHTDANTLPRVQ